MKYVRIEYAGYAFAPDKEINGLTFGGVGNGTAIDYIQVSFANDDSYEWFGGTVNCKHLVAFSGLDDEFDTDYGFSGSVQYIVGLRDPNIADVSKSNGFESDNDATGSTNTPTTNPKFANASLFGPKANAAKANRTFATTAELNVNNPFLLTAPNFLPKTGSPLLTGAVTVPTGLEAANYIGAFGTTDWTSGWANWTPQTIVY